MASPHLGDWLAAPPITSVGLRLSDEQLRISVAHRLGFKACEPHTCGCGKVVDAHGHQGAQGVSKIKKFLYLISELFRHVRNTIIASNQNKRPYAPPFANYWRRHCTREAGGIA